jgi:hypothetical protein
MIIFFLLVIRFYNDENLHASDSFCFLGKRRLAFKVAAKILFLKGTK